MTEYANICTDLSEISILIFHGNYSGAAIILRLVEIKMDYVSDVPPKKILRNEIVRLKKEIGEAKYLELLFFCQK